MIGRCRYRDRLRPRDRSWDGLLLGIFLPNSPCGIHTEIYKILGDDRGLLLRLRNPISHPHTWLKLLLTQRLVVFGVGLLAPSYQAWDFCWFQPYNLHRIRVIVYEVLHTFRWKIDRYDFHDFNGLPCANAPRAIALCALAQNG